MSVMLYKRGTELLWEGLSLVTKIVDEAEVEAHKLAGWFLHPHETIEIPDAPAPALDAAAVAAAEAIPGVDPTSPQTVAADAALSTPAPAPAANPFA